jgi:cytochrome c-type biogenesis protein CcmF
MIVETGHFALVLALVVALVQFAVPLWGSQRHDPRLMRLAIPAAQTQLLLLTISFGALIYAFVTSDFSVKNVFANSHSAKPMIYKVSAAWGNHEGSMLLWVLILAFFGAMVAMFGRNLPPSLKTNVLVVQALVSVAFLLFIIFTSNPFERLPQAPMDGRGLNPILQDFALAIHPPFLYMGYVGFSVAFSFAVAALIEGRVDAAWARWVRPWTLVAWVCLTIGIMLGSWWAYYELGWGGWWFWDPVENASLMPWLAGTALLHSALVVEKRDALKVWTILLSILTFSLSLMGTFLVRSGILSSVHAFAVDPERGVFILGILAFFTGGSLALFAWRAPVLKQGGLFAPVSREGSLVLNNLMLTVACGTVFIGTLWPLITESFNMKISVGAPYFDATFAPLMLPLLIAIPFGPFLAWKRGDLYGVAQRLYAAAGIGVLGMVIAYTATSGKSPLAPIVIGIGFYIIAGAVSEMLWRAKAFQVDWSEVYRRLGNLPRASYGAMLGHIGIGLFVIGAVSTNVWKTEKIVAIKPGGIETIAGYELRFEGVRQQRGPNYQEQVGAFTVLSRGREVTKLEPSKRAYIVQKMPTTETGIYHAWTGDLYLAIGDELKEGAYTVRLYFNPFVRLIWLGCLVMAFGGVVSLSDRRLRVGAPRRKRVPADAVAAE